MDNKNIKKLILKKNQAYKSYLWSNKSLQFLNHFQFLQTKLNSLIEESKEKYHAPLSKKLLDPQTSPKSYWSMLKTLFWIMKKFLAFHLYYIKINLLSISEKKLKCLIIVLLISVLYWRTSYLQHSKKTGESLTTMIFQIKIF